MLKKFLIVGATGALMATTALAQQTPPPADTPAATPAPKSDAAMPAPKADAKPMASTGSAKFITSQSADQRVASKFKGTDVVGPDNAKIGDVDDMLFDKDGKILAVIVGVGGFLGIGQKDVALEWASFQVVPADTSSTTPPAAASSSPDPSDVKLKVAMTKDELKNAPAFEYYKAPARTTGTAPGSNTGAAPRPAAPATTR